MGSNSWGSGFQVFRLKLHTHIHLDYTRVEFLSSIYIYIIKNKKTKSKKKKQKTKQNKSSTIQFQEMNRKVGYFPNQSVQRRTHITKSQACLISMIPKKPNGSTDQQVKFTLEVRHINSDIKEEKVGKL